MNKPLTRRRALAGGLALAAALYRIPGLYAEQLASTPALTEGPFYPDPLPLDRDNDLVIVSNALTPADGQVTHLSGRVLGPDGRAVRGAVVEIWQVDGHGCYLHSGDGSGKQRDPKFQGFGRFETAASGEYRFRTIKPVPYPGRPPHIHVKVKRGERELLTTQIFVKGHPLNRQDFVLADAGAREALLMADFAALPGSKAGELAARFDIRLPRA
jgi:protocatechuate 3,4-dioxygenase beta subunit